MVFEIRYLLSQFLKKKKTSVFKLLYDSFIFDFVLLFLSLLLFYEWLNSKKGFEGIFFKNL